MPQEVVLSNGWGALFRGVRRDHVMVSPEATNEGESDTRIQCTKLGGGAGAMKGIWLY